MRLLDLLRNQRAEILGIASQYGASQVRLFGSVARGEEREGSDIDILVVLDPDRSLMDHAGLKLDLEALLGRPVDVATERGLNERYRDRVLREAIPV